MCLVVSLFVPPEPSPPCVACPTDARPRCPGRGAAALIPDPERVAAVEYVQSAARELGSWASADVRWEQRADMAPQQRGGCHQYLGYLPGLLDGVSADGIGACCAECFAMLHDTSKGHCYG